MSSAPPPVAGPVVLEGRDLSKTYDMGDRGLRVLRGVSLEVRRGEVLAIQGPSGAGKSTLLHLLGLLDEPDGGRVLFHGKDMLEGSPKERALYRNGKIGFVFQFYHLFSDLTAVENVCLPKMVELSTQAYGARRAAIEERARHLLTLVGLGERLTHRPSELSGGEQQRVAIARALMNEPELLLCDEPTGNLDQKRASEIVDLLWKLNAEHRQTIVIVTHDKELARRAHRMVEVVDGVIADGSREARPKGFAETKYRLKGPEPRGGWGRSPVAVAVLAAAVPLYLFFWIRSVIGRFEQATRRRGFLGWVAAVGSAIPVLGNIWNFFLQAKALQRANRILVANGEPSIPQRFGPILLWPLVYTAGYLGWLFIFMWLATEASQRITWVAVREAVREASALFAGAGISLVALGIVAGWIQSLHNAFYDRMRAE